MMSPSAPQVARQLADEPNRSGIVYGIGGALALGVWGFPRATKGKRSVNVFRSGRVVDMRCTKGTRIIAFSTGVAINSIAFEGVRQIQATNCLPC